MLIEGPSGIGKSELCLMLCDRGAKLVSDDQTALHAKSGKLYASPAPNIAGKIEVRNLGILDMEYTENIAVALIIELSDDAPRFIDQTAYKPLLGLNIPHIKLTPYSAALPIKAEWALREYGHPM